ncbi:hypothetical protein U1Q18_026030, partial [Sarracenia purpurea var. burkii]
RSGRAPVLEEFLTGEDFDSAKFFLDHRGIAEQACGVGEQSSSSTVRKGIPGFFGEAVDDRQDPGDLSRHHLQHKQLQKLQWRIDFVVIFGSERNSALRLVIFYSALKAISEEEITKDWIRFAIGIFLFGNQRRIDLVWWTRA